MPRVIDAREQRFGGQLEDYEVGDVYKHWPAKTITEAEGNIFCLLTLAAHPAHIDRTYVEGSAFAQNVVIGTYIYSLLLGMSVPDISGRGLANLGVSELRHNAPMYYGDTLFGATEILEVRVSKSRPGAGVLTVRTTGTNQNDDVVCVFVRSVLLPSRISEDSSK